jgi:serine phosphatase RsbU (regulator of sigma subunit)/protein-S-isoprenylcysteine O-methyltransferase Ste14
MALNAWAWIAWVIYWIIAGQFVHKTRSSEGVLRWLGHVVPLYGGLWLILHGRHPAYFGRLYESIGVEALGDLLTFGGLLFAVYARVNLGRYWSGAVTIKEGHRLIRSGPYRWVRHPIYTGMIFAALGSAITSSTGDGIIGLVLILGSLIIKSRREEAVLTAEFGDEYRRYMREVSALVPYRLWGLARAAFERDRVGQVIESDAFHAAALRSEQFRILGVLMILAFLCLTSIARALIFPQHGDSQRLGLYLAVLMAAAAFEGLMLRLAQRAGRVRLWAWSLSTVVECSFPTLVLLGLTGDKAYVGPYRAMVSSSALIYFLFIILATMRLNPWLCLLAGSVSAAEYLGLYVFTLWVAPENHNRDIVPPSTFVLYPVYLLFAGLLAAGVTRRIRRHVVAALAEAETRRKLDRVEYDLHTARSIQMGLLPKSAPAVEGYDIAGWSRPADQTGGDYYDWIELPQGRILFTIADAAGHGIGPALLIAACRAYFRAIAQRDDPLEAITAQVDALITADTPEGRFITAAIALLEPEEGKLSLYSAGHGPLYLYVAASDEVKTLDADQPPLGMGLCGQAISRARVILLSPGDALVLVTDGFFEWANPAGEMVGIGRLGESIRLHHGLAAEQWIGRLHDDVLAFSQGTPQADDLTAVVIKRRASGGVSVGGR